jgi:hypothetical protein
MLGAGAVGSSPTGILQKPATMRYCAVSRPQPCASSLVLGFLSGDIARLPEIFLEKISIWLTDW